MTMVMAVTVVGVWPRSGPSTGRLTAGAESVMPISYDRNGRISALRRSTCPDEFWNVVKGYNYQIKQNIWCSLLVNVCMCTINLPSWAPVGLRWNSQWDAAQLIWLLSEVTPVVRNCTLPYASRHYFFVWIGEHTSQVVEREWSWPEARASITTCPGTVPGELSVLSCHSSGIGFEIRWDTNVIGYKLIMLPLQKRVLSFMCCGRKEDRNQTESRLFPAAGLFEFVAIDILGLLKNARSDNKHIVVFPHW